MDMGTEFLGVLSRQPQRHLKHWRLVEQLRRILPRQRDHREYSTRDGSVRSARWGNKGNGIDLNEAFFWGTREKLDGMRGGG